MDRCRLYPHRREGCRYLDQSPLERLWQRRHLLGVSIFRAIDVHGDSVKER